MNNQLNTKVYIILSLLGLIFLILIYLYSPRIFNPYKIILLISFILICLLGMWAAINPRHCHRILRTEIVNENKCSKSKLKKGHHPDCEEFSEHTFSFRNKKYCIGCTGLFIGTFLAILTCLLYLIYGFMEILLWTGFIMTLASLYQLTLLKLENKISKFFSNLGLVWGSALILTGILEHGNIFIGIYFLFLVVAWIITRSAVSRENHHLICKDCMELSDNIKKENLDYHQ